MLELTSRNWWIWWSFLFWLSMWFPTILREVYHTKRMQHVICVRWSADNKYVLSGSDEMNIRLWKANASEKLGLVSAWSHFMSKSTRKSFNSVSPGFHTWLQSFLRVSLVADALRWLIRPHLALWPPHKALKMNYTYKSLSLSTSMAVLPWSETLPGKKL